MRLIDADALNKKLVHLARVMQENGFHSYSSAVGEIINMVNQSKTIDAVPKKTKINVQFTPCVCGYTKHSEWRDTKKGVWFYDCLKCGIKSDKYAAKTKTEAKIGWNKMIEELKAGESHD